MIVLFWLWLAGTWLVAWLPRRLTWMLAGFIGNTLYYLMPLRRRVAEENMAHVLSASPHDPRVRRAARLSFQNFVRLLRDVMLYTHMSDADIEDRVTIIHAEHMTNALSLGKGAILVSAHFGNMDWAGAKIAAHFAPVTLVSESLRPPQLMNFFVRVRARHKIFMFPYDRAPRKIIEALKQNQLTTFMLDFGVTHHLDMVTTRVNFFGAETDFPAGPAQLALLTGAPIVVGYARVAENEHIEISFAPPMIVQHIGSKQATIQTTMQEIAIRMEDFIRATPEQWYMFRPMWHIEPAKEHQIRNASLSTNH